MSRSFVASLVRCCRDTLSLLCRGGEVTVHVFFKFVNQVFGSSRALCMRKDGPRSGVDAMKWKSQAKVPWVRRGDAGVGVVTVI